jgi:4-amino-4-deoxy-L-arabinose transferase-like glycosyltransferase
MLLWDEAEYAVVGRELLRGHGFTINGEANVLRPPVPALTEAAALAVTPSDTDVAARLPALLLTLACIGLTGWALARAVDPATGLAAAACLGAMPFTADLATTALSEPPFLMFFTAAIWQLHFALGGGSRAWLWSGAFAALALLTRYTGLLFLPIAGAMIIASHWFGRAAIRAKVGPSYRRAQWLAVGVALLVLAPWLIREQLVAGSPFAGFRIAARLVPNWADMPWHFYLTTLPAVLSVPVVGLAALGLFATVRRRLPAGWTCLIVIAFVIGWHSRYGYKDPRFIAAALPFFAALAGIGAAQVILPALAARTGRSVANGIGVTALAALLVWGALAQQTRIRIARTLGDPSFREAMTELRAQSSAASLVLGSSGPQIAWYADRMVRAFPDRADGLDAALDGTEWAVIVSFERGQPAYVNDLLHLLRREDADGGDAYLARDDRHQTVLVRSSRLASRLAAGPGVDKIAE